MRHSLAVVQLFRILAILAAMQITSTSLNAEKPSAKSSPSSPTVGDNPFLVESTLPYHAPPFDKIKDEHFVPAIEAGMREQLKEVDAIAANSEKPTFDNTIVALERTGRLLDRAERTFSNLNAADTNPTRQKIETEIAPKLSAHRDGSADALGLFKNFVGRDPYIEPLLKRRGLDRPPGVDDSHIGSQPSTR